MGDYSDRIERKLTTALKPANLKVEDESHKHAGHAGAHVDGGGETHFNVEIVSDAFTGQNRIARQRQVYGLLAEELNERVHALSLATLTPEEAASKSTG